MATFLLNIDEFSLISFDAQVRFLQRIANGDSDASLSAMIMDREFLFAYGIGWNAEFYSHFPSHLELLDFNLTCPADTMEARTRISNFLPERNLLRFRESTASFLVNIFLDMVLPAPLATFLGDVPFESVRIFVLFLANVLQRTYLRSSSLSCPFCHENISSVHLFAYSGVRRNPLCDWTRLYPICKRNSIRTR
jgi:hypothetical protein